MSRIEFMSSPINTSDDQFNSDSQSESSYTTTVPHRRNPTIMSTQSKPVSQKEFAVTTNNSLSKLPATVVLGKNNYSRWAIGITRSLRTLCLHTYLQPNPRPDDMSEEEDLANKECITNFLLNRMDQSTASHVESKLKIKIGNDFDLEYEPHKLWTIV